jgi:hypothetical protein
MLCALTLQWAVQSPARACRFVATCKSLEGSVSSKHRDDKENKEFWGGSENPPEKDTLSSDIHLATGKLC